MLKCSQALFCMPGGVIVRSHITSHRALLSVQRESDPRLPLHWQEPSPVAGNLTHPSCQSWLHGLFYSANGWFFAIPFLYSSKMAAFCLL